MRNFTTLTNKAGEPQDFEVGDDGVKMELASAAKLLGIQPPNLNNDGQSDTTTHTTKGTAEEISGGTAFGAGATIEITGLDTAVWVGADAAAAQANTVGALAGVPFRFTMDDGEVTFHVDAATGGTHMSHQVS